MNISSREAMNALDASYPRLASLYDRMMTSARIFTPPKLQVRPCYSIAKAERRSDTIILDTHYLENAPIGHTAAVIGHETGHLLSEIGPTTGTLDQSIREFEHEADQISVHLTGSHDDVSAMRREATNITKNCWRPSNNLGLKPGSVMECIAQRLDHLSPYHKIKSKKIWAGQLRFYGTPEALEANIRRVDLNNRSHLDRLIALRNQETNPNQIT
jgi:hypothetical protein